MERIPSSCQPFPRPQRNPPVISHVQWSQLRISSFHEVELASLLYVTTPSVRSQEACHTKACQDKTDKHGPGALEDHSGNLIRPLCRSSSMRCRLTKTKLNVSSMEATKCWACQEQMQARHHLARRAMISHCSLGDRTNFSLLRTSHDVGRHEIRGIEGVNPRRGGICQAWFVGLGIIPCDHDGSV